MTLHYKNYDLTITKLYFGQQRELEDSFLTIEGSLKAQSGDPYVFSAFAFKNANDCRWGIDLQSFRWSGRLRRAAIPISSLEEIAKRLANALCVLWCRPNEDNHDRGAQIQVGHTLMSEEQCDRAFFIVRGDITTFYRLDWVSLWSAIENRLEHDPDFWVRGYTRKDAIDAVKVLKKLFPWEWVRARYRDVYGKTSNVGMWVEMNADEGFPAYILARTAIGSVCKDPGWNYLISLAESIMRVKALPGGEALLQRIAKKTRLYTSSEFFRLLVGAWIVG